MASNRSGVLIVGGGAAGMAAALAACSNLDLHVTLVDDNPRLGGQIWRAELGKTKSPYAKKLTDAVAKGRVKVINNAQVFAAPGGHCLSAEAPSGRNELEYEKLIIATGARERFLPFPGWTLPNVFGAGGLQALVKGGIKVAGKRVVVAGTGALLLAVAAYLKGKGANVLAIAEQAPAAKINRFALGLWRSPSKIAQAIGLRSRLLGIPYLADCWVTSASCASTGETKILRAVTLFRNDKKWTVECDLLACGFHLVPNVELAALLGCRIENGLVSVDEFQCTSLANVYCAGEPTGIGGVEASLVEGKIAGYSAVGKEHEARQLIPQRDKTRRFTHSLNAAFALRPELKYLADETTIVCRCEDVQYGILRQYYSRRIAKLQTRCGMGACQGRICGAATEFLFGWEADTVRPPIFPVRMENL